MKRGKQGGEVFDRQQYIESLGCWIDAGLRDLAPAYVQNELSDYFEAQDNWIEATNRAADAEEQYVHIMGETSREHKNKGSQLFPEHVTTGYGQTLAAREALIAERSLREIADTVSKSALDWSESDVEYAVWNSLARRRGSTEPTQLNLLEYATIAWSLIELANERANEAIVVVRKRFPSGPAPSVGKGEKAGFSDILTAENFEFAMSDTGDLDIVLNGVKRAKFEEFRKVSYGGRRGLIGSASFEDVWMPTTDQSGAPEVSVEEFGAYIIPDILGTDYYQRYNTLQTLGNLVSTDSLVEQLDLKAYSRSTGIAFSGRGEARQSSERQIGFVSGSKCLDSVRDIEVSDEIHDSHIKWIEDLNFALEALGRFKNENDRDSLLRRVADTVGVGDFWS